MRKDDPREPKRPIWVGHGLNPGPQDNKKREISDPTPSGPTKPTLPYMWNENCCPTLFSCKKKLNVNEQLALGVTHKHNTPQNMKKRVGRNRFSPKSRDKWAVRGKSGPRAPRNDKRKHPETNTHTRTKTHNHTNKTTQQISGTGRTIAPRRQNMWPYLKMFWPKSDFYQSGTLPGSGAENPENCNAFGVRAQKIRGIVKDVVSWAQDLEDPRRIGGHVQSGASRELGGNLTSVIPDVFMSP